MAARIDFYVLDSTAQRARLVYACRLIEKAFLRAQTVYVHTDGPAETSEFDDLLWTFADRSFVPHGPAGQAPAELPVKIGHAEPAAAAVLVNLASEPPAFFAQYERVAEFVDGDPARRDLGRRRFAWYRDQGLRPDTHTVPG